MKALKPGDRISFDHTPNLPAATRRRPRFLRHGEIWSLAHEPRLYWVIPDELEPGEAPAILVRTPTPKRREAGEIGESGYAESLRGVWPLSARVYQEALRSAYADTEHMARMAERHRWLNVHERAEMIATDAYNASLRSVETASSSV